MQILAGMTVLGEWRPPTPLPPVSFALPAAALPPERTWSRGSGTDALRQKQTARVATKIVRKQSYRRHTLRPSVSLAVSGSATCCCGRWPDMTFGTGVTTRPYANLLCALDASSCLAH